MIVDFNHKGLERFFKTSSTAGIQSVHSTKLKRQLTALNEAQSIDEMNFPGWKLHPLKGKAKRSLGHYSQCKLAHDLRF